jgi:hypothetical protein
MTVDRSRPGLPGRMLAQDRQITPRTILGTTSEKSKNHLCSFIKILVILHTGWF